MKNPWKETAALAVLCAAASMSAQAQVIIDENFSEAECYEAGNLPDSKWSGALTTFGTVDPTGTGTLTLSSTERQQVVNHTTSLGIADRYTVGMEFSFNRTSIDNSTPNLSDKPIFGMRLANANGSPGGLGVVLPTCFL